jgi:putative ABC transport system permease protein
MIRHILIAAWRNMMANRLISAIAIVGLAVGIAAALLMALVVRNQMTFDHFIPGHERTYLVVSRIPSPRWPVSYHDDSPLDVAALLKQNFPEVENSTRLMLPPWNLAGKSVVTLKQDRAVADEAIYWADPNVFDVLPLPVFQGDLTSALRRPDGIVLPRATSRKYFGRDDAVGRIILVNGHPMTVRAVIEDLPANATSLQSGIFASGLASFSALAGDLSDQASPVMTFVRLKPGASRAAVEHRLPSLVGRLKTSGYDDATWILTALDQLPLSEGLHPGAKAKLAVTGIIGALILLIAAINFANLLTARAARRAKEVGMRKACGADRRALVLQFLGEAILTVFFATCVAVALCEWLVPAVNAFLGTAAQFDYALSTLGPLLAGILALGLLAGAWPAFVLSSFRPSGVLKGVLRPSSSGNLIRKGLVVLQFAILIGLAVSATIVWQQNRYATREGLRGDIDQMLVMRGGCKPAFRMEVRKLPGVAGAACTDLTFMQGGNLGPIIYRGQRFLDMSYVTLDPGLFALYGIKPLAGTLPSALSIRQDDPGRPTRLILNAAAVRRLGFTSPQAAVGQALEFVRPRQGKGAPPAPIIAVVPDFSFQALADLPIAPTIYTSSPNPFGDADDLVSIRLKGQQIPETLAAIDRLWDAANPGQTVNRFFLDAHMQELYLDMLRQAQLFAIFSGVAIFLACLGLLGLSIATAERRTKEIGIRKAMGAGDRQIVTLLLWQFAQPVLWANVIAWPVAWWLMRRWLSGFAYHIDLHWWVFAGASVAALAIALLTVAGQALLTARQKPVMALRTE